MSDSRQRLAWTFLLGSFFLCLLLTVTAPLAVNSAVQNARRPLNVALLSNQGTVVIDDESGSRALLPSDAGTAVSVGQSILTNAADTASLAFSWPESDVLLARAQIYGGTNMTVEEAAVPRFAISNEATIILLKLVSGRLRLRVLPPEAGDAPLLLQIRTPQGVVQIRDPGQYSLEVSNTGAEVAVLEGRALVSSHDHTLPVEEDQRVLLNIEGAPTGPLASERELIRNGDFGQGLDEWVLLSWGVERSDQPEGSAEWLEGSGEGLLRVNRLGIGHADVSLRQIVDRDVTDFDSLRLFVSLRVVQQSLGVCGVQGSECPLTVRIAYTDANGVGRIWQQGFYAAGNIAPDTPDLCVLCAVVQQPHIRVEPNQVYFYETDLIDELARQGAAPPSRIESVTLVVAGHSFETEVLDVSLLGKE